MSVEITKKIYWARRKVLDMCVSAKAGHLTTAYSCAEILAVLYYSVLRIDPQNPAWQERDRFIMSKNHGSVMQYPYLADLGYFPVDELSTFLGDGSRLGEHSKTNVPGIDFSGGALGIGLGVGCGLAYSAKVEKQDWRTFVLVGDGESYEGAIWEAAMFAGHNKLNNLIAIVDRNGMCCTDFTANLVNQESLAGKWVAFGWEVRECNGHDIEQLQTAIVGVRGQTSDKPLCIIANTVKGQGLDFASNKPLWHGRVPSGDDIQRAYDELDRRYA